MPNNTVTSIDATLAKLASEKTIEAALVLAEQILQHTGVSGLKSNDPTSADYVLLTALALPNAERYDHWFQAHPKFKSNRACFALNDRKLSSVEAKFYALKKKSKLYISGAAHFTPNFEDALFTRQDPNSKVGIDFFLPPTNDSLLVVLSNNKSLRVVELKDRLTNTQKDIFAKWSNVATLEREQLHLTIWDSFKLKSINEAFYKGIANSFKDLVSHLEAAGKTSNEARHFANRLHGRLLFCWFLDKKGFINREVDYFNTNHTDATTYYKEKLELLFFNTLNTPQGERERPHPDLKTPYLNGGLFEAQPDDWRGSNLSFPQGFFVRLYEHFGEFNFTTDESTPDYEQIAIDPEMLGKIFENLLAEINEDTGEQARKAKGAFYTPREIVAYMCRESVREYLYTATEAGEKAKTAIDKLLDTSDSDWAKSGTNSRRDTGEVALREKIVEALDAMKVLDPACGSGAFPIGMLHLLVQLYERLDGRFDAYKTKLGIMERNIYGVDIEPLAIEIARLRSFLALVVDQEYIEKKPNGGIDTLPNLEFKFVCANTLIPLTRQSSLGDSGKYETLLEIKKEYFKADPKKREKLETKYSTLRQQGTMFDSRLNEQLQTYDPFNNDHPAGFYDQHLMHDITDAFSITIGNPPYIQLQKNKGLLSKMYESLGYETFERTGDIYALFYERGIQLLGKQGLLCFITSNKWMKANYGSSLRAFLLKFEPVTLLDFGGFKVFDSATVDTNILLVKKCEATRDLTACHFENSFKHGDSIDQYVNLHAIKLGTLSSDPWFIGNDKQQKLRSKIEAKCKPLGDWDVYINKGLMTGYNDAYYIDDSTRIRLISEDPACSRYIRPLFRGREIKKYFTQQTGQSYVIVVSDSFDIHSHLSIERHLELHKTKLEKRAQYIRGDHSWFAVDNCPSEKMLGLFSGKKIIYPNISQVPTFSVDDSGSITNDKTFVLVSENDKLITYLLAVLNSKVGDFLIRSYCPSLGAKGIELRKVFMKLIPIPEIDLSSSTFQKIESIISEILRLKQAHDHANSSPLEAKIDQLIYELYELTSDEIALIEHG